MDDFIHGSFMNTTNKIEEAQRLQPTIALEWFQHMPLHELGRRAFEAKRARHDDRVTFVQNCHVNPTNLCVYRCAFCGFAAKKGDEHAYSLDEDDILTSLADPELREAHVVGGLWPGWGFARSCALVRRIRSERPDLWIKAFTAVEVAYFARMERMSTVEVIHALHDAGVDALPGGGAEVLSARIHHALHPDKASPAEWLRIHEEAHAMDMPSNATLLFGHIETDEELIDHLFTLRDSQDRVPGFDAFVPLAYQPDQTGLVPRMVSAPRCLRVVALSRLVLDNIPHIKSYWPTLQIETAVAALNWGADDLDGTLGQERIMQLCGSKSPAQLTREHMIQLIREAGQEPVERDGAWGEIATFSSSTIATRS